MSKRGSLVLSRKVGQKVIVGDNDIEITVSGVNRGTVRLTFSSDTTIPINREEIYLAKKEK